LSGEVVISKRESNVEKSDDVRKIQKWVFRKKDRQKSIAEAIRATGQTGNEINGLVYPLIEYLFIAEDERKRLYKVYKDSTIVKTKKFIVESSNQDKTKLRVYKQGLRSLTENIRIGELRGVRAVILPLGEYLIRLGFSKTYQTPKIIMELIDIFDESENNDLSEYKIRHYLESAKK